VGLVFFLLPFDPLNLSGYFTYHQVQYSEIQHGDRIAKKCSVWIFTSFTINRFLKNKNQLDATYYFIVLLIGSKCFGHCYAHHQKLATEIFIAIACSPDTTPAYPHLTSKLQQPKNEKTNLIINIIVASF